MSESNDQSYYEIALTNRQAIFFFVFLLVFVLLVFLSGVWVGRSGQKELVEKARLEAAASASQMELASIPEVQLGPGGRAAGEDPASPPDLSSLEAPRPEPGADTPPPAAETAAPAAEPSASQPTASQPPVSEPPVSEPPVSEPPVSEPARTEPARTEPVPAATPAPVAGSFVIQVFSTKDEAQAKKVLADLKGAGFKAFSSPVKVGASTMHRVRIGPFQQRSQADSTAAKVKEKFRRFETWVTAASN